MVVLVICSANALFLGQEDSFNGVEGVERSCSPNCAAVVQLGLNKAIVYQLKCFVRYSAFEFVKNARISRYFSGLMSNVVGPI